MKNFNQFINEADRSNSTRVYLNFLAAGNYESDEIWMEADAFSQLKEIADYLNCSPDKIYTVEYENPQDFPFTFIDSGEVIEISDEEEIYWTLGSILVNGVEIPCVSDGFGWKYLINRNVFELAAGLKSLGLDSKFLDELGLLNYDLDDEDFRK